ncbi:MAG: class I SAM-dependent methyltransferase [bacterium]
MIRKKRDKYALYNKGVIGKLIYRKFPYDTLRFLSEIGMAKSLRIVDVGCGTGSLLYELREIGFKNTLGIDPYLKEDIKYKNGLEILKKTIHDLGGKRDLVMFHHSFEHVPDPVETIQSASNVLTEQGVILMRIPIVSSYAWKHYGINWVQLDAPRHFFLHSIKSINTLAAKANLRIKKIIYDSTDFQFWGSEQYTKDIPLKSNRSYAIDPSNSIFSDAEIKEFKQKAKELNLKNWGDQAVIYLKNNHADDPLFGQGHD